MPRAIDLSRIERELEQYGINVAIEDSDGALVLTGLVDSVEQIQAADDIVANLAPERRIENNLETQPLLPDTVSSINTDEAGTGDLPSSVGEITAEEGEVAPDFTDQTILEDPVAAAGPSGSYEDPAASGDGIYVPPTDPVVTTNAHGKAEVLGGFETTSMDDLDVTPSSDGQLGDEAIADAIRRELREDAMTTDLEIEVAVYQRVARLRGRVARMDDADSAEEVASRVPGVREVIEALEVATEGV